MRADQIERRLAMLGEQGAVVVDPRQTYVDEDVLPERASGMVEGAVLLRDAKVGPAAHIRAGTLLEEEAVTAHAVGLKHTILLSFVTFGSLINLCDALVAGGTSRADHSEIGSGFIHFNYTPWGKRGDKATPSLMGDVVHGVFLRQPRVFLGGAGGLVGPRSIGFGSVTAAGQVVRRDVPPGRLVHGRTPEFDIKHQPTKLDSAEPRAQRNVEYIAQLVALSAWYREVRLARVPDAPQHEHLRIVFEEAARIVQSGIEERVRRLDAFLKARGRSPVKLDLDPAVGRCPLDVSPTEPYVDHVQWVQKLPDDAVEEATHWLHNIAQAVIASGGG
jgi:UDP-N-acetylglucosamine/UDP-N-acetylgalactosamine diphosphorylase